MKLRIGILIDQVRLGGVEKIAIDEVNTMSKLKYDTNLLVLRRDTKINNYLKRRIKDLPVVYLDDRLPKFLKINFKFPFFQYFSLFHITYPILLTPYIKKNEYSYIFSHGTFTSFSSLMFNKFKKIEFSIYLWDPIKYIVNRVYLNNKPGLISSILNKIAYIFDKLLINGSTSIILGGNSHKQYIRAINKKKSIEVIYPSTDPAKKLSRNKKNYVLLTTVWKKGKNPEYLYELIKKIPNINIVIAGKWLDNEYKTNFIDFIKKNKIDKNIKVIGEVDEKDLKKIYSEALVLLQINDDRGFGMVALEAAGNGTSFIIPEKQGVCELFIDKRDGFFTKEKDTTQIVNYLNRFLSDKNLSYEMGKNAWTATKENYSWEIHARKLVSIASNFNVQN